MKEYVLQQAIEHYVGRVPTWMFIMSKPDGTNHGHVMPRMTLDARAIEYDIDIEDRETLLDIAIHEAWMVHPEDEMYLQRRGPDPAIALGLTVPTLRGGEIGVTCHTADTLADGRAAHMARLEHCKSGIVTVTKRLRQVDSILKHREEMRSCAGIEDSFRTARRFGRQQVREARRAAANR